MDHIPHMGPAVHLSGHLIYIDLTAAENRQLTQILKRLGISLTYHIGLRVIIKHVNELPGGQGPQSHGADSAASVL